MAKVRKIPLRSCVACGRVRPKRELVRVVRTPSGAPAVDTTGKVSGRGAYVCPEHACVERALRERRFDVVLETPIPEAIADVLRQVMQRTAPGLGNAERLGGA